MTDENQNQENEVEEVIEQAEEVVEAVDGEELEPEVEDSDELETEDELDQELDDGSPKPTRTIIDTDDDDLVGGILALSHGSLTKAFIEEIQNAPTSWQKMSEADQREVIERCKKRAAKHITKVANAILNRGFAHCEAFVDTVTHKDGCKATLKTTDEEGGLELARRQGENVLVVFTDEAEYIEGAENFPTASPDQGDFLSDNSLDMVTDSEADALPAETLEADPLFEQAVDFVIAENNASISALQHELKIGYNRAERMLEQMQEQGIVGEADESGLRAVIGLGTSDSVDFETGEVLLDAEMLERYGSYDLIVTGSIEASVQATNIEDAVHSLGYTEFEIVNKGESEEFARVFDDERIEDNGASIEIHYSESQDEQ